MRRCPALALTFLIQVFLFSSLTFAICPSPEPQPCSLFHRSKAVFIGTVVREQYRYAGTQDEPRTTYTLKVIRSFRGPKDSTIKVFTSSDSAREELEKGRTYLVFASAHNDDKSRRYRIFCMDTREVKDVDATIRMMERIQAQKGPVVIRGIVREDESGPLVPNADIEIRGDKKTFHLKTDKQGRFSRRIPPGNYAIVARSPAGKVLERSLYNWEQDDGRFEPGQCVSLVFVYQ